MSLALVLSPGGHLHVEPDEKAELELKPGIATQLGEVFGSSSPRGLELLAGSLLHEALPATFVFWRGLAQRFFTALCHNSNLENATAIAIPKLTQAECAALVESAPPMKGLEYLTEAVLTQIWEDLEAYVRAAITQSVGGVVAYLQARNPVWHAVGRVTLHLAENKRNPAYPFAFLATYTHRLSQDGKVQHLPLGRALEDYAGAKNRDALAALLSPVQRAAERSKLVRELLDSRAIFHPQVWRPEQAFSFLQNIPHFEQSGLVVRIPDWWKAGRPPRPQVTVRIGEAKGKLLGTESLLDFKVQLSLEGEPLTESELQALLQSSTGLVLLKGKWVEVDQDKLQEVLKHWKDVESAAGPDGVGLLEGLRLISGFEARVQAEPEAERARADWSNVVAGEALKKLLEQMQQPEVSAESDAGPELRATLRPYQRQGAHWLWFMNRLGLGACLADDMGLGKTIQVLALLLVLKKRHRKGPGASETGPSLLIVPASLIANWKAEIQKFAPSLSVFYAHPSETPNSELARVAKEPVKALADLDLVITSYSMGMRLGWLKDFTWKVVVLDEAQAIKNAGARQTRAVKELRSRHRLALSGTPIENRLSDLWSLFDFLCPGLLGGAKEFSAFLKSRSQTDSNQFAPLRRLVRPYILRRLKTDKRIISDLPDKTEVSAFCSLTRRQAALYQQAVAELGERLEAPEVEGIQRRGIILAFLTRFKQICNHPSQWLGDGAYAPQDSGKFHRLDELCGEIASRQQKVLVFTQYREMTEPLASHLSVIFRQPGLILHGGTPVAKRQSLVDAFQQDEGPPFFVLSLKAGGTGLNLTAASHVIHFDRWWNPAVENQATDRAFRIGQKKNVLVHKFTCRGTLEERINEVISNKSALAEDVLGAGGERLLTEMSNADLLRFVALDIKATPED
jgi:hypothetical protein